MNRPKRKKSKDNPYTLLVINNKYYVEFKDVKNILNTVEVTEEQFEAFNEFVLEDKSQINKDERHKEKSEVYEETLYKRFVVKLPLNCVEIISAVVNSLTFIEGTIVSRMIF